jgi:hypothetical protein
MRFFLFWALITQPANLPTQPTLRLKRRRPAAATDARPNRD